MENLLYLELLHELEDAEINDEEHQVLVQNVRDPFTELSDDQFKKMFRLTKDLCRFVINLITPHLRPKLRPTDLDISVRVLVALRFFATGSYQWDIGVNQFLHVSQSSVSRSVKEVIHALTLPQIYNLYVKFPGNFNEMNRVRRGFSDKYGFPGIVGCIDCTHVAIFPPKINDPEHPEHLYVNRKGYHSINVQLVCDSNLKILNVIARYPGSSNDSFIWNNSNLQDLIRNLHANGHKDYFLLGDSGYPQRTWLMTPVEGNLQPGSPEYRYNTTHKSIRSIIERCNGVLKMRFRCLLKHRVLHYSPDVACDIIKACVLLHNLCIEYGLDYNEENVEDEYNFGMFNQMDQNVDLVRNVNPDLADGRTVRNRIIRNLFRN